MKTTIIFSWILVAAIASAGAAGGPQPAARFEGIWKKCYEPGLEEASEIDSGYLVLMPDKRYYELSASCCHLPPEPQPPFSSLGAYTIQSEIVTLQAKRFDGSAYEIPLRYRAQAKAVFFDAPRAAPDEVEALLPGDDLNYAWCRVFPALRR